MRMAAARLTVYIVVRRYNSRELEAVMGSEIERFAKDLQNDDELCQELADFGGSWEELTGWLNDKGYRIEAADLADVIAAATGELDDEDLGGVSGGTGQPGIGGGSEEISLKLQMTMDRRSKAFHTMSNIMQKVSSTQDTIVQNIK